MIRKVIALVAGLVSGFMVTSIFQAISTAMHPVPEGIDLTDFDALREWVIQLPVSAFVIVLASHVFGAAIASFVCAVVVRHKWLTGTLIIGGLLTLFGIANLVMIPHPVWFAVVDTLCYLPSAFVGAKLAGSLIKAPVNSVLEN